MSDKFTNKLLLGSIWDAKHVDPCCDNGGGGGSDFILHTQDTATVDLSGNGTLFTPLEADVKISAHANNIIVPKSDGIYAGAPDFTAFAKNGTNIDNGWIELGGILLHNTAINQDNYYLNFYNGNVGIRTQDAPSHALSIGDDIIGVPRMFFYAPDGTTTIWETSGNAAAIINAQAGIYLRPHFGSGAGSIVISEYNVNGIVTDYTGGGAEAIGRIGTQIPLEPGVSVEFFIKPVIAASTPAIISYLSLYSPIKLKDVTQDDAAPRVVAMDADDNIFYIASSVLGGGGATAITEFTFSGTGAATTFNIPHGLSGTPKAVVTAGSTDAAGITYITTDSTNIIVHYAVAPSLGTNNGTIYWQANL